MSFKWLCMALVWIVLAAVIVLVTMGDDAPIASSIDKVPHFRTASSRSQAGSSENHVTLNAGRSTTCINNLGMPWPAPDASTSVMERCKSEQTAFLAAERDSFVDERAFQRTIDMIFSSEGRRRMGLHDLDRRVRLVTAHATYDSLWSRYPGLGRGYVAHDRLIVVDGNNVTTRDLVGRANGDERVEVHSAVPWREDAASVLVRFPRDKIANRPVKVVLVQSEASGGGQAEEGVRAARLDTLLPPSAVGDRDADRVDVLLIGDASGQEAATLEGASELVKRTRIVLFVCSPRQWSEQEWEGSVRLLEDAGHTVVLLGRQRHLLLSSHIRPTLTPLHGKQERSLCMAAQTGGKEGMAVTKHVGFLLELLLAGRRAVLRSDTTEGVSAGVKGSPCVHWLSAQIARGCPAGVWD